MMNPAEVNDKQSDSTIQKAINYVFKNKCSNQCKWHNIHVCGQDFYSNKKVKFTQEIIRAKLLSNIVQCFIKY